MATALLVTGVSDEFVLLSRNISNHVTSSYADMSTFVLVYKSSTSNKVDNK